MKEPLALAPAQANPWTGDLIDLESLHARATDAILSAVRELSDLAAVGDRERPRPAPLVVLGTAGIGKTHLFARLRRKLGPRAVLVHVRPLVGSEITPRFLLGQLLEQLGYESYGVRQVDALAGTILANKSGENPDYPRAYLDFLASLPDAQRTELIENALEELLEAHPDIDEPYVRRLLSVPFMRPLARSAALAWLGGRELDEPQAARIGVREPLSEEHVTRALRTLAVVSAPTSPLVLAFDQLENLVDGSLDRVRAYGNLIADLVDVVRDTVILQMALDTEWARGIEPSLSLSQRQRAAGKRLLLDMPSPEQCEALLKLWVARVPEPEAPFPWPFTPAQLEAVLGAGGVTPRMLLLDLRRALEGELPLATANGGASEPAAAPADGGALADILSRQWQEHTSAARGHIDAMAALHQGVEPALLVDGLLALASLLGLEARSKGQELLEVEGRQGAVLVSFVHQPHPRSRGRAGRGLASLSRPVLAVREQWRELKPTWSSTLEQWRALLGRPGACWLWLEREDVVRLLALGALLKDARSGDISGPDALPLDPDTVRRWVTAELEPATLELARVLLGEATGRAAVEAAPSAEPARADAPPVPAVPSGHAGVLTVLHSLRVASLERLQREVARIEAGVTRAAVVAELRAAGARVKWFGESIVSSVE